MPLRRSRASSSDDSVQVVAGYRDSWSTRRAPARLSRFPAPGARPVVAEREDAIVRSGSGIVVAAGGGSPRGDRAAVGVAIASRA